MHLGHAERQVGQDELRLNPRKAWYRNLDDVVPEGDHAVAFVMKRAQPAFLMLLASGMSPVYPCHVPPAEMRRKPIGTGPFKFAEFKPNEYIKLTKNTDYWKPGRPYLDAVEWTVVPNRSTQSLAFIAGKFDMTFPYEDHASIDARHQEPGAGRNLRPTTTPIAINLLVNRDAPPFDSPDIRRAMLLALDRKSFLEILVEGQGDISGALLPPPGGLWGLPPEILETLPGYGPDVETSRAEARKLMEKPGYGPDKRLAVKVATRNIPQYRDPAVILIDQMKHIYIDGELEVVETANWFPKIARKDYMVGVNCAGSGVDDPDAYFYEHYACGSERNYTNYCNPELEKIYDKQSMEPTRRSARSWSGRSTEIAGGRRAADDLPVSRRHLPLSARQERHRDGQHDLQRLAFRGYLARPVTGPAECAAARRGNGGEGFRAFSNRV